MTTEFKNEFKTEDANSYNSVVGYFDQYTERFTSHMPEPMLAAAGLKSAARVLDVGTGTGVIALDVVKRLGQGTEVVGIDLSDGMLATAAAKARAAGLDEQVSFLKMDAENLDFEDESFDAVLSLYALRHFPNPDKALQEMFRVLKPGGAVVVAVGSSPSLLKTFTLAFGMCGFRFCGGWPAENISVLRLRDLLIMILTLTIQIFCSFQNGIP